MPNRLLAYLSIRGWKTRLVFWAGALAVGGIAALFAKATVYVTDLQSDILHHSRWWALIITPAGMVAVAGLTRYLFPGTQGSGIPQAIAALQTGSVELRSRVLSFKIACGKILMTLLGLFSGASIGREGPTVHVGASILYSLGRKAKFPQHYLDHGLILAGGAAGISAAFNTPIAGIMFAIEEMARTFEEKSSGTLLTAVILAGVTTLSIMGNYTYFGSTSAYLPSVHAWVAVPVCGLVGGLMGGIFSTLLIRGTRKLTPFARRRPLTLAAACGLLIAALGLLSKGASYGTGYDQARHILAGDIATGVGFPLMKIIATITSYLSGIPGGLFSPSLSAGAGIGGALAPFIPSAPAAAVVLLGMVAYFTGVVQTPITASIIVMEMVNANEMILPIMATAFIALGTSKLVCRKAIYWSLAEEFLGSSAPPVAAVGAISSGSGDAGSASHGAPQ